MSGFSSILLLVSPQLSAFSAWRLAQTAKMLTTARTVATTRMPRMSQRRSDGGSGVSAGAGGCSAVGSSVIAISRALGTEKESQPGISGHMPRMGDSQISAQAGGGAEHTYGEEIHTWEPQAPRL